MLYSIPLEEETNYNIVFDTTNSNNKFQELTDELPNSYEDEIRIYREIFDESFVTEDDYSVDNDGILLPGKNKHHWRTIKFDLPVNVKNGRDMINFDLHIYLRAPLFSIFANNKDELYKQHGLVINVWPFMHNKKFIRDNISLITKMSPTVDIMNYPIRFYQPENWRHIHSEKYFFSKKYFEVRNQQISNYFGDYFTWGIHQNLSQPVKLMLLTYEFISPLLKRKFVRTCAMAIFNSKLTKWINSVE